VRRYEDVNYHGTNFYKCAQSEFCSMKITQDVRDYAAKQKEIEDAGEVSRVRASGGEVYLPADVVRAQAEETVAAD
jgi:phosphomethylpyrimidine synthase